MSVMRIRRGGNAWDRVVKWDIRREVTYVEECSMAKSLRQ